MKQKEFVSEPKPPVLITGSSRGIGRAAALVFASHGHPVVINCKKDRERLLETQKEIEALGAPCLAVFADVGDEEDCARLFSKAEQAFGPVGILVNNAGISHVGLFQDMSLSEWNRIIQTNLTSVFLCCREAVPSMIRQGAGSIVNISSVWGVSGASCEAAYSASKGGVGAFTQALAKELAPSHIQVNALACGAIDTEMNEFLSEEDRQALEDEIPAGRMGKPEEAGETIFRLATASPYLTGQIIRLDGGWI